jgi:hypothetical protein
MLHKHRLHRWVGVRELGIAVREEDYSKSGAEKQQAERLERVQKFHGVLVTAATIFPKTRCKFQRMKIIGWPARDVMLIG